MALGTVQSRYRRRSRPYVPRPVRSYVRRAIAANIEEKRAVYDLVQDFGSVGTAWVERNLTRISQSPDLLGRVGRRVNVRSIEIKGVLAQGASGTSTLDDPFNAFRIVLGLYSGPSSVSDFPLQSTTSVGLNTPIAPWNVGGTASNFRMIRKYLDRFLNFSAPSVNSSAIGTGLVAATRTFRYFKRFKRYMFIQYGDGTPNSADRWFCLSMISDSAVSPCPGFISGYVVLTYEDA